MSEQPAIYTSSSTAFGGSSQARRKLTHSAHALYTDQNTRGASPDFGCLRVSCSARGARGSPPCDRALRARRRRPVPEPQRSAAAHTPRAKAVASWWTHGPRMVLPIVTSNDGDRRERLPSLSEGEPRPIAEGEVKSPPRGEDVRVRCCDNAGHGVSHGGASSACTARRRRGVPGGRASAAASGSGSGEESRESSEYGPQCPACCAYRRRLRSCRGTCEQGGFRQRHPAQRPTREAGRRRTWSGHGCWREASPPTLAPQSRRAPR